MKLGAYQVAGRAPPSPVTAIVVNVPITTTTTERAPAVGSNPPSRNDGETVTGTGTPPVFGDAVRPPVLALDLERARLAAESGDLAAFISAFYPAGTSGGSQQEAARLSALPRGRDAAALCDVLLHAHPEFSPDGREVWFRITLDIESAEDPLPEDLPGFLGDLESTIQSAISTLEAADYRGFVLAMYPASEMNRYLDDSQLLANLERRLEANPQMVEAMQADLQACLDEGFSASETIAEAILVEGRRVPRVVRFERVDNHWRFVEPAPVPSADVEAEFETVTLVHDGQQWRLKDIPECLER
jgi:hypothetical protein